MLKFIFLMIALLTLLLNIYLTFYLIKNRTGGHSVIANDKRIVNFDLSQNIVKEQFVAPTEIMETEMITFSNQEE